MDTTRRDLLDEEMAARWSFALLAAIVAALLFLFFYLALPFVFPPH
ncbi:MAG: hypothetical protein ACXWAC_08520 [Usitatibacter sp.]